MLLLAVIVAILGIVNTLVLSVVERTRELALLRAVGATRSQVRTVVRRESVLMALLGALTGVALGTVAGIALSRALLEEGITTLSVPTGTLLVYLVIAALVGVLAAIGPARLTPGVTMAGKPAAMASTSAIPKFSWCDGSTNNADDRSSAPRRDGSSGVPCPATTRTASSGVRTTSTTATT